MVVIYAQTINVWFINIHKTIKIKKDIKKQLIQDKIINHSASKLYEFIKKKNAINKIEVLCS